MSLTLAIARHWRAAKSTSWIYRNRDLRASSRKARR
jgi:hypothetical protein